MPLVIPYVWSPEVLLHSPETEVWVGRQTPGTEVAARATVIRAALQAADYPEVTALAHPDDVLLAVHEAGLVDWLRTSAAAWAKGPYEELVGQRQVVPHVFPTPMMTAGMPWRYPTATHARAGVWCYDTMTPVGSGTWEAARAAVDVAATAAGLVARGERAVYALTRPPGHHATPAGFGGSCYLNNAAVATRVLTDDGRRRVAVLDVDAHHGNGTQAVFWNDSTVFYGSAHVDPGEGWFPHVNGFAEETGPRGDGPHGDAAGTTLNVPMAPGSGDEAWLDAVLTIAEGAVRFGAEAVVISLGVDAAGGDSDGHPESPLQVTEAGFAAIGRLLASMELPTVLVQEGGYHLETLGTMVTAVLEAF